MKQLKKVEREGEAKKAGKNFRKGDWWNATIGNELRERRLEAHLAD